MSSAFDLSDKASVRRRESKSPIPVSAETEQAEPNKLDSEGAIDTHNRLLDAYVRELDRQEENRNEQAIDEDFYDNIQWDPDDARALDERGQVPLVYNVISTTVNWLLGTERRGRSDYHILPRRKEDGKPAERKSQLLKYLSDCNRTPFHRSRAFADSVKVGVGWMEDAYLDDDENEPIVARYESWRNMLWDSAATEFDLKDARYLFRSKWVDLDVMKALFPQRSGLLEMAARDAEPMMAHGDDFGDEAMDRAELEMEEIGWSTHINRYHRERLRVIEAWFKAPMLIPRLRGGSTFSGEVFDPHSRGHVQAVNLGEAEITKRVGMQTFAALMTINGLLWLGPSPYRHNRYPFTPIWGNRRGRDGLPYGIIRGVRTIQEDINKRASKALFHITARRVIVEEGAADDMDELAEEAGRPDAFLVVKAGRQLKIEDGRELADAELEMMSRSIAMIQQVSGVTDENLGRKTNATAGVAIEKRQLQGAMATTHYFDNLRLGVQIEGEKQLSLVEQFMGDKKAFRITNMRGKPEYVDVNDGLPENDIAASKADFVISDQDWRASMREAAAAELFDLLSKLAPVNPQLVVVMLDLLVESMDIGNREELVRRIREMTGMRDPDAEEPTPEEIARAQEAQKQSQLQEATVMASLRKLLSEASKNEALALKTQADTAGANIISTKGAVEIAGAILAAPPLAPVADEISRDAGVVSRTEKELTQAAQIAADQKAQQQQAMLEQADQLEQQADQLPAQAASQQPGSRLGATPQQQPGVIDRSQPPQGA